MKPYKPGTSADFAHIEALVMRAKAGDKGAAGALIEAYTPMLNAFARKADDPEDCFQDLALALLKGLQAFDPARGNVTGYFRQYLNVELLRRSDASHLDYRGVSVTAGLSLDMPWGTEDGVLAEVIPDDGAYAADQTVMDPAFMTRLEGLRQTLGRPVVITSGVRCPVRNKEVGGIPNSWHLTGHAADCYCPGMDVYAFGEAAREAGFGVIVYGEERYCHIEYRQ